MSFFSMDGPFVKYMTFFADIIILGVLFLTTSLPIITIGPSITAMFYVMTRRIHDKEGYIIKDYFKSFVSNFFQSLMTSIVLTVLFMVLCFNIILVLSGLVFSLDHLFGQIACLIYMFLILEIFFISLYVYPVISRFEMKFFQAIKMSFILANRHLPTTISIGCLFVLIGYLTMANPFFCFITSSIYAAFASYFLMKVFRKYNPTMDMYEHEISYQAINDKKEEK